MSPTTCLRRSQERLTVCWRQPSLRTWLARTHRLSSLFILWFASFGGPTSAAAVAVTAHASTSSSQQRPHISEAGTVQMGAFDDYLVKYGRTYRRGSEEYDRRRMLFEQRSDFVENQNARPLQSWKAAVGPFADRTDTERAAVRGWRRRSSNPTSGGVPGAGHSFGGASGPASLIALEADSRPPHKVDWRFLSVARQIIDQSSCGSCWAATAASVLEAHYELHHGSPRSFSVQEILSCTPNPRHCGGSGGCDGATVEEGMEWVLRNGINDEATVPYEAKDTECSRTDRPNLVAHDALQATGGGHSIGMVGWETIMPKNQDHPLARAVYWFGPVAVSVAADDWHEYSSGIFDACPRDVVVDHAVTLYGYGEENGKRFWRIRNTWGKHWGEKGFIRLLRQAEGQTYCGTDSDNQQGVGCVGDPKEIEVCGMCGVLSDSVVPHFAGKHMPAHSFASLNRTAVFPHSDVASVESGVYVSGATHADVPAGGGQDSARILRRERT